MKRRMLTLFFAAIPASMTLPILAIGTLLSFDHIENGNIIGGVVLVIVCIMSLLGIIGLWMVCIQNNYKSLLNMILIGCGTLVAGTLFVGGLFVNVEWYLPTTFGKDTLELAGSACVLGFGIFYSISIGKWLVNKQ
jgi:hypothetical protein